jgi:hypothetical protein
MNEELSVLVLITPARRRDDVVDALMSCAAISGFTMSDCAGFSREHSHLNLRERVQGYGDYERFEILCCASARAELLPQLAEAAGRDHFRYWLYPLLEQGVLAGTPGPENSSVNGD